MVSIHTLPEESLEGDYDYEPKCPVCETTHTEMFDYSEGSIIDCACGARLTVNYRQEWALEYNPPTGEDKAEHFANCCRAVQGRLYQKYQQAQKQPTRVSWERSMQEAWAHKWPTWANYSWPDWVPQEVRQGIEEFHTDEWKRGPASWMMCAHSNRAPAMGSYHVLSPNTCNEVHGRYIHCWNNIGRVIAADGRVAYCSVESNGGLSQFYDKASSSPHVAEATPCALMHKVVPR